MKIFTVCLITLMLYASVPPSVFTQTNRSIDGYGNNSTNPLWGALGSNQLDQNTCGFSDGISNPAGLDRPNARMISNNLFSQNTLIDDPRGLSAFCWAWGQFIDHDITLVNEIHDEKMEIPIPAGDVYFDPHGTGAVSISMSRSNYDPASGLDTTNPRTLSTLLRLLSMHLQSTVLMRKGRLGCVLSLRAN